jgi:hypothetical protein
MSYGWRTIETELVELCDECGFDARLVRDQGAAIVAALAALDALTDHVAAGRRPQPDTYSADEYAAHCVETTTELFGYVRQATGRPSALGADDLAACSQVGSELIARLSAGDRAQVLSDVYPFPVTVGWILLHLLHDLEHHVLDIKRGYARLALADHPSVYTIER